jgi:anaerobic selenocysteine-containing dehydrogenase
MTAHADLFMNPTADMADVVLPVASAFEREGLKIGFEISAQAQSLVQLREAGRSRVITGPALPMLRTGAGEGQQRCCREPGE